MIDKQGMSDKRTEILASNIVLIVLEIYGKYDKTQLFQASATARHCLTSFKVEIQLDHFCIGDGSYIDVHKFIRA